MGHKIELQTLIDGFYIFIFHSYNVNLMLVA